MAGAVVVVVAGGLPGGVVVGVGVPGWFPTLGVGGVLIAIGVDPGVARGAWFLFVSGHGDVVVGEAVRSWIENETEPSLGDPLYSQAQRGPGRVSRIV